jgi:hypothetical protein
MLFNAAHNLPLPHPPLRYATQSNVIRERLREVEAEASGFIQSIRLHHREDKAKAIYERKISKSLKRTLVGCITFGISVTNRRSLLELVSNPIYESLAKSNIRT